MLLSKCLNVCLSVFGGKRIPEKVDRILVVKWDEIGDMVSATGVFAQLKEAFPNAKIDVLCKPFVKTLIEKDPNVNRVVCHVALIEKKYSIWVELRGDWSTFFQSIYRTKLYRVDRGTVRFKQRGNQPHETVTNYRIIEPVIRAFYKSFSKNILQKAPKLYAQSEHIQLAKSRLEEIGVSGKYVVIHPAARRVLRQWPIDRFAFVAKYLWETHQLETVVVGAPDESPILYAIKGHLDHVKVYASTDSLLVLHEIILQSEFFLGNESGPLQIADVSGKPVIGIFGPGVKNVFYPIQNKHSVVLHHVLDCNPCDQRTCVKGESCVNLISTLEVTTAIEKVLSTK